MRKQIKSLRSLKALLKCMGDSGVLESEFFDDIERIYVKLQRAKSEHDVRVAVGQLSRIFLRAEIRKNRGTD